MVTSIVRASRQQALLGGHMDRHEPPCSSPLPQQERTPVTFILQVRRRGMGSEVTERPQPGARSLALSDAAVPFGNSQDLDGPFISKTESQMQVPGLPGALCKDFRI